MPRPPLAFALFLSFAAPWHGDDGAGAASRAASRPATDPRLALEARARALRDRHGAAGFTVVVEPPFLVIGDEGEAAVRRWAEGTVRWARKRLRESFFDRDPEPIDVWLFKDAESYGANVRAIFGEEPGTPFGYYAPRHRALLMNIATGGGTLVHELVHPFVHANFPGCPAWLNEGLGSLFEQCTERDGAIEGLPNWRLGGLQDAIRGGRLRSFDWLLATADDQFYGDERGTNYAQARYLCYYLQDRGILRRFWREFLAAAAADPTGAATLRAVLGARDLAAFQEKWETFVMGLRFP